MTDKTKDQIATELEQLKEELTQIKTVLTETQQRLRDAEILSQVFQDRFIEEMNSNTSLRMTIKKLSS